MEPTTLQEAILYFADADNCREYLMARRWPDGVKCPTCGSAKITYSVKFNRWQCGSHHAKRQFTLKTGTPFEDSPIGLEKWLPCVWMITGAKNGISSWEISRALGVTQKTAWFMLHRVRLGMQIKSETKLSGEVEADETFIGGKVGNMHRRSKRSVQSRNDGDWGKAIVLGLLEREGHVRAAVAPNRRKHVVHSHITANVEPGSKLYTDEFGVYNDLPIDVRRSIVNHVETYVKGRVHTNGMENFWSLLKRTLKGTYISVDPAHLQAYVDEQAFRFNNRKDMNDADRFSIVLSQLTGKRLTWNQLTGQEGDHQAVAS